MPAVDSWRFGTKKSRSLSDENRSPRVFVCIGLSFFGISTRIHAADPKASPLPGVRSDIEFAKVEDVRLTLDAFVPEGPGPFPTCILVHGGGFVRGDKQSYIKPIFEPLSKAGFTWFTINYRLAPQHRGPHRTEDVERAIRWVKANAKEYKVDINRIA